MSSAPQFHDVDLSQHDARGQLVDGLRRQLGCWEAANAADDAVVFSCGAAAVDRLLPGGGLRHGMLVEWLAAPSAPIGGGAATIGLLGAREACREGGALVVIDRRQTFYPPAAAAWGVDLERMIVVHPQNARDELWAAVQALRSPAVAAMFAAIDRLDSRAFRRLQLAAQAGQTLGVLVRPTSARGTFLGGCAVRSKKFRISDFGFRIGWTNPQSAIRNPKLFESSRSSSRTSLSQRSPGRFSCAGDR